MNGVEADGTLEPDTADEIMAAVRGAIPWPTRYAEAVAEHVSWVDRAFDLSHVLDDVSLGFLDIAVQFRAGAIRSLVERDMPADTIADVLDRVQRFKRYGAPWRIDLMDAVERDLAALATAEAKAAQPLARDVKTSVKRAEAQSDMSLDAILKAHPDLSDREIARRSGVSAPTVGKARRRLGLVVETRSVKRGSQMFKMKRRATVSS